MFKLWTEHGRPNSDRYALSDDFSAIEYDGEEVRCWKAYPTKKYWNRRQKRFELGYKFKIARVFADCDFAAIGSGAQYACGYLMGGGTPEKAIVAASTMDSGTNNDVEFLTLDMDEPKASFAGKQYELF
jgi:hypothetical protein